MQRIDNDIEIDNSTSLPFVLQKPDGTLPSFFPKGCFKGNNNKCNKFKILDKMGINYEDDAAEESSDDGSMGTYGEKITLAVPVCDMNFETGKCTEHKDMKKPVSFGFNLIFYNGISSIKYTWDQDGLPVYNEDIQLLDPAPYGTGEWVTISAPKWDYNWVEFFVPFAEPFEFVLGYRLPEEFGDIVYKMDYQMSTKKWYIPAAGTPYFNMTLFEGTPRRIQFTFNNTDTTAYQPPPCFIDWPEGAIDGESKFSIGHCPNISEGTYDMTISAWNPADSQLGGMDDSGWFYKTTKVEVLARVGPIQVDDFLILSDYNETKRFNVKLDRCGQKTCVVVDFGDDDSDNPSYLYYGNLESCQIRFPDLKAEDVEPLNIHEKTFDVEHIFERRGMYKMHVYGFDERHYAEALLDLTIFRLPCNAPSVYLPKNHTSFLNAEQIPKVWKSKSFQTPSKASVECNVTTPTYMKWRVYSVELQKDENSQVGKKEILTEIQINDTVPSWNRGVLDIPPLTLDYGLHKLVFRFDIETYEPSIQFFKEAFTYVNITKSPLMPVLLDGSPSKVSRGWGQTITMFPNKFSIDPDSPEDRNFNYTWFCRVVAPDFEEWEEVDDDEYPVFDIAKARGVPRPSDAILINAPPGCFGQGPQPLKTSAGIFGINTASLITYSRIYEILLILSKDTRRAMVKLELDLGAVPAPIAEIKCINQELCFPRFGGVFVNPTSRLALKGTCSAECIGSEDYIWTIYRDKQPKKLKTTYCGSNTAEDATTTQPPTSTTGTSTSTTWTAPWKIEECK